MIEITVLNYLNTHLNDYGVYMEVPENPPVNFIVIEKVNGGVTNKVKSATFAIRSYSGTLLKAAQMNEAVKEVMEGITDLSGVSSCRLDRDYNFTDTKTKRYRYQSLFEITHY